MARILIDTNELRNLRGSYSSGAEALSNVQSALSSTLAGTVLNDADPGMRAARVHDRQHVLNGELARIAAEYRADGDRFAQLAESVESREAVGGMFGWAVGAMPVWGSLVGLVGSGPVDASVLADLTTLSSAKSVIAELRMAGLAAFHEVRDAVAASHRVGRSALDGALGLVAGARDSFAHTVEWAQDLLAQLATHAWEAIWGGVTIALQRTLRSLSNLVTWAAQEFVQPLVGLFVAASDLIAVNLLMLEWGFREAFGLENRYSARFILGERDRAFEQGMQALGIRDLAHASSDLTAVSYLMYEDWQSGGTKYRASFLIEERNRAVGSGIKSLQPYAESQVEKHVPHLGTVRKAKKAADALLAE